MGTGQYPGRGKLGGAGARRREGPRDAAAPRPGPVALRAPVSGVGVPGNRTAQARRAPRPLSTRVPGPFRRRPPRFRPLRRVPLAGPPGLARASLGRRPPAASPATAHLRAPGVLLFLPPEASGADSPRRPASRPRAAPPPRSRNRSLQGLVPASSALVWRHFRQRRPRAASVGVANAPGASQNRERAPRLTTNSSRGGCGGVRLSICLGPCRLPPCFLASSSGGCEDPRGGPHWRVPARPSASRAARMMGSP